MILYATTSRILHNSKCQLNVNTETFLMLNDCHKFARRYFIDRVYGFWLSPNRVTFHTNNTMNASKLTDIINNMKKTRYKQLYISFPDDIIIQNNQQSISIIIEFI